MKRIVANSLIALSLLIAVQISAQELPDPNKRDVRGISRLNALNFKTMPAFYWDCVGLEVEYPISETFTVGLNALFRYGRTDNGVDLNFKIRPEEFQDPGIRLEFALKHYFPYTKKTGKNAPVGLYVQANAAYMDGNNLFFDGNSRPYTFTSRWKYRANSTVTNPRVPTSLDSPQFFSVGAGIGYQAIVIPNHIIANVMLGSNLYIPRRNSNRKLPYAPFYVSPSIGFVF